jgi:hypothetical protein
MNGVLLVALWLHTMSAKYPPLSWVIHGLFALPLCLLGKWTPFAVFLYRELEQAIFAHVPGNQKLGAWLLVDRIMDIAVPTAVGLWLG